MFKLTPIILMAFYPKTFWQKLICFLTGSKYIHVGLVVRAAGNPHSLSVYHASKEKGEVIIDSIGEFLDWACDYYQLKLEYEKKLNVQEAHKTAEDFLGKPYGWRTILWLILSYIPFIGKKIKYKWPELDINCPHCAALISIVLRHGGIDPCPEYSDAMTTPDDLCNSPIFRLILVDK
jgi:hypothetical protein